MEGDDSRRGVDLDPEGPGIPYLNTFCTMEDLLDKLKLIDYETDFCRGWSLKPLSRHYFAVPTNPGEQFSMFTSLVAWLLNQCHRSFERPQEYDDPNATVSNILDESRKLITNTVCLLLMNDKVLTSPHDHGISTDFPPSKLKSGSGEQVIYLLDKLADEALKAQKFSWQKPSYLEEDGDDDVVVEDDLELTLDKLNEELQEDIDEVDEEESYLDLAGLKQKSYALESESKPDAVLEATVDASEWKLEVERVLPKLKVHIRTDNKDWRFHYEQMKQYSDGISTTLVDTKTQLDKLHNEISKTLEKIGSREKYINNQLETLMQEYRAQQDQLAEIKERYKQSSGGVTDLTQQLAQVTEELEQVKQQMDERGTNMTDAGPLVRVKQALSQLRQETMQMELRIGVVEHTLQQARLREKNSMDKTLHMQSTKDSGFHDYKVFMR